MFLAFVSSRWHFFSVCGLSCHTAPSGHGKATNTKTSTHTHTLSAGETPTLPMSRAFTQRSGLSIRILVPYW